MCQKSEALFSIAARSEDKLPMDSPNRRLTAIAALMGGFQNPKDAILQRGVASLMGPGGTAAGYTFCYLIRGSRLNATDRAVSGTCQCHTSSTRVLVLEREKEDRSRDRSLPRPMYCVCTPSTNMLAHVRTRRFYGVLPDPAGQEFSSLLIRSEAETTLSGDAPQTPGR